MSVWVLQLWQRFPSFNLLEHIMGTERLGNTARVNTLFNKHFNECNPRFYTPDIFSPFIFQNCVYQWSTLLYNSLFLGSLNSKPMMVYLMLNNTLMGTHNAYLNVMMKGKLETLVLKFSKQTKPDNDRRIRWVIPGSTHRPKERTRFHRNSHSVFVFVATERSWGKLCGWHTEETSSTFLFIY